MSVSLPAVAVDYPGAVPPCAFGADGFDYADGLSLAWSAGEAAAFAPPPDLSVAEWADARRVLQAGIARSSGPWRTDYTPYLRAVMDAYSDESVRHLVFAAGTQLGKTEALYNILGYIIDHDPYPTLLLYPREDDAKLISRTRLQPMIDDCPTLRDKKPERAGLYQTLEMHFPGMILYLAGANSLAGLASKPCRNLLRDEIGKFPELLGRDADPLSKSEERTKSFWDIRKIVDVSSPSPGPEDIGILRLLAACDVIHVLHHPCPHCRRLIRLYLPQVVWDEVDRDDPHWIAKTKRTARYVCQRCGAEITGEQRPALIAGCRYVAQQNITFGIEAEADNQPLGELDFDPESVGFWVSSLSSPMLSWADICEAWLRANLALQERGDRGPLMTFVNDWLAEPWKEVVQTSSAERVLARRVERPPLVAPSWAVALTAGIDPQKWGFWQTVWAFDQSMRSALIHYGFLESWEDVFQLCFDTSFVVEGGDRRLGIWRAAMDIGGGEDSEWGDDWTKTEEIVTWIREHGQGVVHATKGMSRNTTGQVVRHSVLDKMPGRRGGLIPGGLVLWLIDTQLMKDKVFWRLDVDPASPVAHPQPAELHGETGMDFALQLTAEEKRRNRDGSYSYVRIRRDNHYLDTSVGAHAAADFQWMGGVKILSAPLYLAAPAPVRPVRGGSGLAAQRGYSVQERLRGRR